MARSSPEPPNPSARVPHVSSFQNYPEPQDPYLPHPLNPSMYTVPMWDGKRSDGLGGAGAAPHVLRDARQAPGMIYSMSR